MSANDKAPAERASFDADGLQPPARGLRRLAFMVGLIIVAIPLILAFTPWRQNVSARGRVVAYDPLDRLQRMPAPVTGRIVEVHVLEGSRVEKDELLIEMSDLDPQFRARLEAQVRFAEQKLGAARESLDFYTRQVANLGTSREMAITVAQFEADMAQQKVRAAEQDLAAARANLVQKKADVDRQERLFEQKLRSELDAQKARAAYEQAEAKVESAQAKIAEAKSDLEAKKAKISKVDNDTDAKLQSVRSSREDARAKVSVAEKELQDARSKLERQQTQFVRAPRNGIVLRIHGAGQADLVSKGQTLIEFIPDTEDLAVELWLKGNDAPLVSPGAPVRLNFEGWPAIQFVGWPSVAQGTFGGIVSVVDAHDDGKGKFRILVKPDPNDKPWPDPPFMRQGVQTKGWVLLQEVSLGYELWRQLNGFPPALEEAPEIGAGMEKPMKIGEEK